MTTSNSPLAAFDVFDVERWPLVKISFQRPPLNDLEIDKFQARFCSMLSLARNGSARVAPVALQLMMNLDGIVEATLPQQMRAAGLISAVREYVKDTISATGLIVGNETAKVILDIIIKLQPLQSRHAIFATAEEAEAWFLTCNTPGAEAEAKPGTTSTTTAPVAV